VVFDFLAETGCQSSEAAAAHADREIATLDIAGRNLSWDAVHYLAAAALQQQNAILGAYLISCHQ
jgi:hypothetical protein